MQAAPVEVVGLVGPSGSGKSTLLKCLGAVIEPATGSMTLGSDVIYDKNCCKKLSSMIAREIGENDALLNALGEHLPLPKPIPAGISIWSYFAELN